MLYVFEINTCIGIESIGNKATAFVVVDVCEVLVCLHKFTYCELKKMIVHRLKILSLTLTPLRGVSAIEASSECLTYKVFQPHLLIAGKHIPCLARADSIEAEELNVIEESRSHLRFLALSVCAV
jgi:hypothetical protein